jgi:hypothetical protein
MEAGSGNTDQNTFYLKHTDGKHTSAKHTDAKHAIAKQITNSIWSYTTPMPR